MSKLEYTQHAGTYELLSTKLTSPRLRSSLVSREQLLARLDEGLEHKLTLLSAPAGFGKTTLVSEWIATRSERHDSPPVAWVSLDAGDNDPVRFWRYVITACQVFDPAVGESTLALLHMSRRPSLESVLATFINELATFINELAQLAYRGVLVLEDYHVITAPQIHESVGHAVIPRFPWRACVPMTTSANCTLPTCAFPCKRRGPFSGRPSLFRSRRRRSRASKHARRAGLPGCACWRSRCRGEKTRRTLSTCLRLSPAVTGTSWNTSSRMYSPLSQSRCKSFCYRRACSAG